MDEISRFSKLRAISMVLAFEVLEPDSGLQIYGLEFGFITKGLGPSVLQIEVADLRVIFSVKFEKILI